MNSVIDPFVPLRCPARSTRPCALVPAAEGGQLYTFGETEGGKLGHARSPCASPQPVTAGDGAPYVAVACGGTHTAAVTGERRRRRLSSPSDGIQQ